MPGLAQKFLSLSEKQKSWLLERIGTATDVEACELASTHQTTVSSWKKQPVFVAVYVAVCDKDLEIIQELVMAIEASNALTAAIEKRKLIEQPWGGLARVDTAKGQAINDTLERIVPKKRKVEHSGELDMKEIIFGAPQDEKGNG